MRRELNVKIDQPESITAPPPFHPQAANRWFKRRRISIAESYLMVVRDLDSRNSSRRLTALKNLADVAFRSSSIDYPLNTARVQSALVKEVVKHRSNKRRQLELLYDFSMSTQGQHQVIRKLCDELNIIELPENGMKIGELGYAWDDHVHDVQYLKSETIKSRKTNTEAQVFIASRVAAPPAPSGLGEAGGR